MRPRARSYVSHGHSDHARPHELVIATPGTAAICQTRFERRARDGKDEPVWAFEVHEYNEPWRIGDYELTLFSAGHVLGSSQLLIEGDGGRFVYTGDFKLEPSYTTEPVEVKRCDTLLMECTYGKPQFVFPPREDIAAAMVEFARATLAAGQTPVFFAYSLGKAQEAMAMLGNAGIPLTLHGAVAGMAEVYEQQGMPLPPWVRYDAAAFDPESAVLWPPGNGSVPKTLERSAARTAALTGWSLAGGTVRTRTDVAFPLSDHADFPSLVRYIETAQPKKVLLNHGFRECTGHLRKLGIDAEFLDANPQLSLF